MKKDVITHDFSCYHRTIKRMVQDYYRKLLIGLMVLLLIECGLLLVSEWRLLTIIFIVLLIVGLVLTIKKYQYVETYIENEMTQARLSDFTEDEHYYYIPVETATFSKKRARNLTSEERGMTFFIGLRPFNYNRPVSVRYYDMLEMTYTEKFKLTKHQVSFARSRWKYRIKGWIAAIPAALFIGYIFIFRLSFIGPFVMHFFATLFNGE